MATKSIFARNGAISAALILPRIIPFHRNFRHLLALAQNPTFPRVSPELNSPASNIMIPSLLASVFGYSTYVCLYVHHGKWDLYCSTSWLFKLRTCQQQMAAKSIFARN